MSWLWPESSQGQRACAGHMIASSRPQLSITAVWAHRTARLSSELLLQGPSITGGARWRPAANVSSPGKTTWACRTKWKRFSGTPTRRRGRQSPKVRRPNFWSPFQAVNGSRQQGKLHFWAFWITGVLRRRRCPHQIPRPMTWRTRPIWPHEDALRRREPRSASSAVSVSTTENPSWCMDPTGWRTEPGRFCVPSSATTCVPCAGPRGPKRTPCASVRRWTARTAPSTSCPNPEPAARKRVIYQWLAFYLHVCLFFF